MNASRWAQVEKIYHGALELSAPQRPPFLAKACGDDADLRREVESLLAQAESAASPMDRPAWEGATSLLSQDTLKPGSTLGPYEITGVLGEGGMGRVYSARDSRLGRSVAIKFSTGDFGERFRQEARAVAALNHPNICTLHDIGPNYLVMELVDGETLGSLLHKRQLPADAVLRYGAQLAGALAAAQAKGITHRDLKPANIMVTKAGLKVLDFGLAKITPQGRDADVTVTASSMIMGTPGYMAPEQLQGAPCDARTDIFALGLVLYEMAAGRRPFPGSNPTAVNMAILRKDPAPLEGLSPVLTLVIERCLRKDPDERWQSATDVQWQLEFLSRGIPEAPAPVGAPKPGTAQKPRRWRLAVAAVAVAVAGAGSAAYYKSFSRSNSPQPEATMTPVTSYSGSEVTPSFSPDGQQVAFAWNGANLRENLIGYNIYVKQVGVGDPIRLTKDPSPDLSPKWSPDGKWIAFLRYPVCERTSLWHCPGTSIYAIPALGGLERKLAETVPAHSDAGGYWGNWYENLDWTPDGKWLVMSQRKSEDGPAALVLLSFETGEIRPLLPPTPKPFYASATISPDGHALAYWREGALTIQPLNATFQASGAPQRISLGGKKITYIPSLAWTADSRDILLTIGSRENSTVWRVPASGESPPRQLTSIGDGAAGQTVARLGDRMMFSRYDRESDLWSLSLDESGQATGEPVKVFNSSKTEMNPNFSPDGTKVAFASNRSGNEEAWVCLSDGTNCSQLTNYGGPQVGTPRWSPDGNWIAFDLFEGRPTSQIIPASGGKSRLVTEGLVPRWSKDGQWLYSWCGSPGSPLRTCRTPVTGGKSEEVFDWPAIVEYSPDGAWLYYSRSNAGPKVPLMRRPAAGDGQPETVIAEIAPGQRFVVSNSGIWYATSNTAEGSLLKHYDLRTKSTRILFRMVRGNQSGMALSPDARRILFTQVERLENQDLVLVEPFR